MRPLVRRILILHSLAALYTKYYVSYRNGFFDLLHEVSSQGSLPGLPGGLRTDYTGVGAVDRFASACVVFFWPVFDGSNRGLSLFALAFAGAMIPVWVILIVQWCQRHGLLSALMKMVIYGMLAQCLGLGLMVPLILAGDNPANPHQHEMEQLNGELLVLSWIASYITPLCLAALPAPGVLSYSCKQLFIAAWQGWPVYFCFVMLVVHAGSSHGRSHHHTDPLMKCTYKFALACSAGSHIFVLWAALADTDPPVRRWLIPHAPWNEPPLRSVEAGILRFLHWDYALAGLATLLWSMCHYCHCTRANGRPVSWVPLVARAVIGSLLCGPCAEAIRLYRAASESQPVSNDGKPHQA